MAATAAGSSCSEDGTSLSTSLTCGRTEISSCKFDETTACANTNELCYFNITPLITVLRVGSPLQRLWVQEALQICRGALPSWRPLYVP